MSIPANSNQWAVDTAVAERERTSVSKIQSDRENAALAREILPGTLSEIDRELEAAEAARQAALDKKSAVESIAGQWDSLLDAKLRIERELLFGAQRIENLDVEGRGQFVDGILGGEDAPENSLQQLTQFAAWIAGSRLLRDDLYPKWKKAKEAALAAHMAKITEFAKANRIPLN